MKTISISLIGNTSTARNTARHECTTLELGRPEVSNGKWTAMYGKQFTWKLRVSGVNKDCNISDDTAMSKGMIEVSKFRKIMK